MPLVAGEPAPLVPVDDDADDEDDDDAEGVDVATTTLLTDAKDAVDAAEATAASIETDSTGRFAAAASMPTSAGSVEDGGAEVAGSGSGLDPLFDSEAPISVACPVVKKP